MKRSLLALCLLAACARSSDPRLYTLVPTPSRATHALATTVEIRRPSIAGYLDRREIVRAVRGERLDVAGDSNWAEPLDTMVGRVLATDLALRLPESRVAADLSALGVVPETRIDIEIQRFEHGADGLVLRALVAVRRLEGSPVDLEVIELVDRAAPRDTEDTVAAMNALLGKLADRIASAVASAAAAKR